MNDYTSKSSTTSRIEGGVLRRLLARLPILLMFSLAFSLELNSSRERVSLQLSQPDPAGTVSSCCLFATAHVSSLGRLWLGDPQVTFSQVLVHY